MSKSQFSCQQCGTLHSKWSGQCTGCGEWNTLVEEAVAGPPGGLKAAKTNAKTGGAGGLDFTALNSQEAPPTRIVMGVDELDRVFGGGLVPAAIGDELLHHALPRQ